MLFCGEYNLVLKSNLWQVVNCLFKNNIDNLFVRSLCLMSTAGFIMFYSMQYYIERTGGKLRLKDIKIWILKIIFRTIGFCNTLC